MRRRIIVECDWCALVAANNTDNTKNENDELGRNKYTSIGVFMLSRMKQLSTIIRVQLHRTCASCWCLCEMRAGCSLDMEQRASRLCADSFLVGENGRIEVNPRVARAAKSAFHLLIWREYMYARFCRLYTGVSRPLTVHIIA